ncbi:hypothetical protein JMJ35_009546 [Cladonia borealis]|uniref:Uncharacterized protein n=1 Tax=Cladonia borealis TaxID=184061 RepID=A0AA39UXR4_9LECA|nr:hypothetical protein JMJ35_009546 [Cladonia borealis]
MNNSPVDSILKYEPCTLTKSEKKLYNATINSWNETLRQQRFEACMAMEKEAQATASKLRASDKEDNNLRNGEVSGTAAHFAREMELRARRAAIQKCSQGQKRKRTGQRSDWSKRQTIPEFFGNKALDLWDGIRNHRHGDEMRALQARIERCEQRKRRQIHEKREVDGSTCQS